MLDSCNTECNPLHSELEQISGFSNSGLNLVLGEKIIL